MAMKTLTQSMKSLTENLEKVQNEKCSEEFLIALDELIEAAEKLRNHSNESRSCKKRRLTDSSSASSDVRCISVEIETITVDSDTDDAEDADKEKANGLNISSSQGKNITELCGKRAVVKLRQIDTTSYGPSAIHGLDREYVASSDGDISRNSDMPKARHGQVSMVESEIMSDENFNSLGHYTHENIIRKTYRDVCVLQ